MINMVGLDAYASTKASFVGIDWLNMASGALKTTGGAFGGSGGGFGGGGNVDAQAAAQAARDKQAAAEKSASNWKLIGVVAILGLLGGGYVLYSRKK